MATKVMEVVKKLDIERYMGRWYEIASFPSRFQPKDGENTRATYTLNTDGTIHVLNETWSNGKRGYIEGTAYKADPKSDEAKLKVKFYVPPFLPIIPVTGDYWVLFIDNDYQYALIGQPSRNYLWPKDGENFKHRGTIHVLNETWSNGKRGYIEGTAYKADPKSDEAKVKVKFYVPPFLPIIPVTGDYWVLFIDKDYQYALIGQPSSNYLWILCRKTCLDDEIYNQLVEKAKEEGYDVSKLHKTPQSDSPPESEDGPKDTKGIWWIKSILGK